MRKHYDFSNAVSNPYVKRLKKQITIRVEQDTLTYFKQIANEAEMPYQTLINLFLRECASQRRRPKIQWKSSQTFAQSQS
jgi:predicted DNA binding CopG/RHH family protein